MKAKYIVFTEMFSNVGGLLVPPLVLTIAVSECERDKGGVTPYVFIAIIAVRYQRLFCH